MEANALMTKLSGMAIAVVFAVAIGAACSKTNTSTTPTPTATSAPAPTGGACSEVTPQESFPPLPGDFPLPAGIAFTSVQQAGPSTIVNGRLAGDLGDAFDAFNNALTTANFTIEGSEQEEDDAEIEFEGNGTNGQIRLGVECEGAVEVTITIRPA